MKSYDYKKNGLLILGINGWVHGSHDMSAALIEVNNNECKILGCLEEEKVVGKKNIYDRFPVSSIKSLLKMYNLEPEDIDQIAVGWNYPKLYDDLSLAWPFANDEEIIQLLFGRKVNKLIPVTYIDHHKAHAASAYRASQFDCALCFVIDGNGERESYSVWRCEGDNISCVSSSDSESSLGFLFEATNLLIGFNNTDSGKTMGLAAYGAPVFGEVIKSYFDENISANGKFRDLYNKFRRFETPQNIMSFQMTGIRTWLSIFTNSLNIEQNIKEVDSFYDCEEKYKNVAASVQKVLEEKVLCEVQKWICVTGIHNICIAGGVGLNCTMNGKILQMPFVDDMFVQPASGDSGVALGAALERAYQLGRCSRIKGLFSPYLGSEIEDREVVLWCEQNGIDYIYRENAEDILVNSLCNNESIAVFQGRNEWGPRALGARSILSLPQEGKLDFINKKVKKRELGRPLGPSMLEEDAKILESNLKTYGRYMNIAYCTTKCNEKIASIIHVDGTYRPQFVNRKILDIYHNQLELLKKIYGNSIVINTSFNVDTPIIYNIKQAISFLEQREITKLFVNNRIIISKNRL